MALDPTSIKEKYPIPVYNYQVTLFSSSSYNTIIGGIPTPLQSNESTVIGFSEVSGLSQKKESVTYRNGLSFMGGFNILPGISEPIHLTFKKGITQNGSFLNDWINVDRSAAPKQDILIDLCDETGTPIVRWTVLGALPIQLIAPTFDPYSNDVAIESMELIAHELKVEYAL